MLQMACGPYPEHLNPKIPAMLHPRSPEPLKILNPSNPEPPKTSQPLGKGFRRYRTLLPPHSPIRNPKASSSEDLELLLKGIYRAP